MSLIDDTFEDVFCGKLARANMGPPAAGRAGNDDDDDDGRNSEGEGRAALGMDCNGLAVVLPLVRDVGLS